MSSTRGGTRQRQERGDAAAADPATTDPATRGAVPAQSASTDSSPGHLDHPASLEDEHEPLSLAEEIAEEANREGGGPNARYEKIKQSEIHIAELQKMSMAELIEEARQDKVTELADMKRQDLIFKILKERVKINGLMYGEGTLEVLPDGFGFLRSPDYHYLSCPDDIYVSPSQIRRFGLQTGATVSG